MKIAYLSVYRDGTGYGNSARDFIKCLSKQGADVVPVWFTLNSNPVFIDQEIQKRSDINDVDVVIQQTIPNSFVRIEGVKNIGLFYWETSDFLSSGWQHSCNIMDEIWVTTPEQKQACINSGVKVPVKEVTRPANFEKYTSVNKKIQFGPDIDDTYKFYTISDFSYRKNISGLVAAFFSEFNSSDNVSLVIKSYIDTKSPVESLSIIKQQISEIKAEIKRPENKHPKIHLITQMMSDDGIMALHNSCNCFVSASRGEGECIPAFEAGAMGKPVVATNWNGIKKTFGDNYEPTVKEMIKKPVFAMANKSVVHGLYFHKEWWMEGSLCEMMKKMRSAKDGAFEEIAIETKNKMMEKFSYESVGPLLMEALK
jgi:glycosyltransferase involved in cell wall biosynthesis